MPGGDRTGPMGMGPRTGRAAGYCAGFGAPGFANPMPGRGYGRGRGAGFGRGMGRGFGRGPGRGFGRGWPGPWAYGYGADHPPVEESQWLRDEIAGLSEQLEFLKQRLSELSADQGDQG